jgi:hypothetical protein
MNKIAMTLLLFFASAAYGEIYTWKDSRGTAFYTNSLHEIPARYRSKAKILDVATGKKFPLTEQPGGLAGPASTQAQQPAGQQPSAQAAPALQPQVQQPSAQATPVQQTPVQRAPAMNTAPSSPAVATPSPTEATPAASVTEQRRQAIRAQRRAARHNRTDEE